MNNIRLLLVEDDANLSYIISSSLQELIGGYEIITASNGAEGLEAWNQHHPDVIIADIDMPVMNGFQMVEKIRETDGDTLIFFTSALTSPEDVSHGYRLGVNNYLKKPFVPEELDASIKALLKLKRGERAYNETQVMHIGSYAFDARTNTLQAADGIEEHLTETEGKILRLLIENQGEIVSRDALMYRIWGNTDYYVSRSLDVFVRKLRIHLSADPAIELATVRGQGLKLEVKH
ncbi:MAG: response regulator transcription factor [Bacteroidaceae bacterium]|nr:response regulator transcription factor [Bacteroidaceae bacterium]